MVLADTARDRMLESYSWVKQATTQDKPVYGVNTGFGSLARVKIDPAHSSQLSLNLIRSHAAGVGPILPVAETRAMMLLRANALAKGVSAFVVRSSSRPCFRCSTRTSRPWSRAKAAADRREIWHPSLTSVSSWPMAITAALQGSRDERR